MCMVLSKNLKGILASLMLMSFVFLSQDLFGQQQPQQSPQQQPPQQQPQQPQHQAEDFSDEELRSFVRANAKAMEVQQEIQQDMMQVIEEEDISMQKFNEMAEAQQQQNLDQVEATPEEKEAFNNAAAQIMELQAEAETQLREAIEEELSIEKFQAIMQAYQQDPALQARVNQIAQEEQNQ
jgi:hypothetical protein